MTDSGAAAEELDCIVVGGGLAGLACAHGLAVAGRRVRVLEAEEAPGGRARTVWHRGRPVDRGFQVLFRAYPRTRALLRAIGLPRRDLRPVSGGAVFIDGDGQPAPRHLEGVGARLLGPAPGRPGPARPAGVRGRRAARPRRCSRRTTTRPSHRGAACARRASPTHAIEGFFRPLFGVILLDRSLSADPGYFRFLLSMLVRGPSVIPSDGVGMIAEWTSAAVRQAGGTIDLGVARRRARARRRRPADRGGAHRGRAPAGGAPRGAGGRGAGGAGRCSSRSTPTRRPGCPPRRPRRRPPRSRCGGRSTGAARSC